jgi:VanZ family protein
MKNKKQIFLRSLAPVIMVALFVLSSFSALPSVDTGFMSFDKLSHFIAYGALGFSMCFWVSPERWNRHPWLWGLLLVLICVGFGVTDEFHQTFVPHRSGMDGPDLLADAIGAVVCISIFRLFRFHRFAT